MSSRTPGPPRSWSPVDTAMASDAVRSCSFLKVGDGTWVGGFVDTVGRMWDIVETGRPGPSAWELRLADSTDKSVTKASSLELAIARAVSR